MGPVRGCVLSSIRPLLRRQYLLRLLAAVAFGVLALFIGEVAAGSHLEAPSPTPILYDRTGAFLAQLGHERGTERQRRIDYGYWAVAAPLPDRVVRATLALEDHRFWSHPGVDGLAVLRALWQDISGGRVRSGASTIAMQIARMQDPRPRTLWAKAVEAATAVVLTERYGRQALLAHYLRLVPYGNGSHGIAHAARWYLDKPVADLSWAEIALLSAIPQAPAAMNPATIKGLAHAKLRGQRVLSDLAAQGVITPEELTLARAQLTDMDVLDRPGRPREAIPVILRLRQQLADSGGAALDPHDPRLTTTLDLGIQATVGDLARQQLHTLRAAGTQQVAVLVVRRATREVVADVGSARYGGAYSGSIDFSRAIRSPGSTLKPFLYAVAMQRGLLAPTDILSDMPEGAAGISNADRSYLGPLLPRQALANSRNVPAAKLLQRIGLDTAFNTLRDLGIHDLNVPAASFGLSMAIGSLPTSLDRLVRAYGALADDGTLRDLVWYRGQPLAAPRRVISADAAREVTLFLADPMARMPSFPRYGSVEFPFPVALKTGTSQGYRDAWIVAWSKDYMVGVWFGRPDAGTMQEVTGASSSARLAQAILLTLEGSKPGDLIDASFPVPEGFKPVTLCVPPPGEATGYCAQQVIEFVKPAVDKPAPTMPTGDPAPAHLAITMPEQNARLWRNPESPPGMDRLALKAASSPGVTQVVWYVDGLPFKTAAPDETVYWPMTPGVHHLQIRLPLQEDGSRMIRIVVE